MNDHIDEQFKKAEKDLLINRGNGKVKKVSQDKPVKRCCGNCHYKVDANNTYTREWVGGTSSEDKIETECHKCSASSWLRVKDTDWCGEWKEKEGEESEKESRI